MHEQVPAGDGRTSLPNILHAWRIINQSASERENPSGKMAIGKIADRKNAEDSG
jgi:hypothetical protein